MPKLTGIFSSLDFEDVPAAAIAASIKPNPGAEYIENYIGNKLLYPQAVPVSKTDIAIEKAILIEIKKKNPGFRLPKDSYLKEEQNVGTS